MSDRSYRMIFGALLLVMLYFDQLTAIFVLMGIATFEGISNLRIPTLIWWLRGRKHAPRNNSDSLAPVHSIRHFEFEAERAFRLSVVIMLACAYFAPNNILWWLPWFMGFATLGAGISGVCPVYFSLRWIGFSDSNPDNDPEDTGNPAQSLQ